MTRPYLRGAVMEAVEAIDHIGWKWWKMQEPNLKQAQIEIIDIWHFALSHYLTDTTHYDKTRIIYDELESCKRDQLAEGFKSIIEKLETFASLCAIKMFNLRLFLGIMEDLEISQQGLFNMYVAKNVLNEFRQKNGYKSGDYVKIWNGREDNEHLEEFMGVVDSSDENYIETLRYMLTERYKSVVKDVDECYLNRGKS